MQTTQIENFSIEAKHGKSQCHQTRQIKNSIFTVKTATTKSAWKNPSVLLKITSFLPLHW